MSECRDKVQLAVHYSECLDLHHARGECVMEEAYRADLLELLEAFTLAEWDEYRQLLLG